MHHHNWPGPQTFASKSPIWLRLISLLMMVHHLYLVKKIRNSKEKIRNNLSKLCKLDRNKINIKAKTTDRLGIIGENKALACEVLSVLKYDQ